MTITVKNYFLWRIIEIQLESLSVILTAVRALEQDVYFYSDLHFRNSRNIHPNNLLMLYFSLGIILSCHVSPGAGIIPVWRHVTRSTNTRRVAFYQIKWPGRFLFQS